MIYLFQMFCVKKGSGFFIREFGLIRLPFQVQELPIEYLFKGVKYQIIKVFCIEMHQIQSKIP